MKAFAELFTRLDQTTSTKQKVAALKSFFDQAGDADKLWTIAILSHRRPKRTITTTQLREWAAEYSGLPLWLLEESYHVVGDLAETIALLLPPPVADNDKTLAEWIYYLIDLYGLEEATRQQHILQAWQQLNTTERFVFNKLITGGFRMGVSQKLMTRALAQHTGIDENTLSHRLMGQWSPMETTFEQLILTPDPLEDVSKPYPFCLAYPLEEQPHKLGPTNDWIAEWKWDGIRCQLVKRAGEIFLWSRGEELITDKFPELQVLQGHLPDGTVIDGELLPFKDGEVRSFQVLQTRIGRKHVTPNTLKKAPVVLRAYDLLEWRGEDLREMPFEHRRQLLEQLFSSGAPHAVLQLSEVVSFADWEALARQRQRARSVHSEGLMLKHRYSPYHVGRKKGDWWKWKVEPLTIDAVLLYAQRGHGRRANLYTDYTFAVWDGDALVPVTKAYSGLTDAEIRQVDSIVKRTTKERFGPVRSVEPTLVFEIAFEGIAASTRHKSGVALRFPRMHRWRKDKPIAEANTLADLQQLLQQHG